MSLGGDDGYGDGYRGQDRARTGGTGAGGDDAHLTRTRLPEGDGDPYGAPRRTGRTKPSRNLITVVSVVVLLIAAIAFANRGGDDDSGGSGGSSSADGGGNDRDQAQPTAPTGVRPVDGKNPATGIASGFPRTEQGAQSAAANYAVALGSVDMYDKVSRHAIVSSVFSSAVATATQRDLDRVYTDKGLLQRIGLSSDGDTPQDMIFVSRANPAGTKAVKFDGDRATVAVWYSSLLGLAGTGSKNPVAESWYTKTFELRWDDNDWKISSFTQKDGPTPVGRDQAASSAEDMADAVQGFGGFTYAR